ncbi:uncharacterized protein CTRU02_208492 [Colletotrichum truncatum]|uniref:Uncharacterized protein n=1 Tax=Colletotrichum truncatum TaxID=5467 RepID=A0ACC3YWW3_COLTU|nr:uncharacterized protein CTRU02_10246 [Colletotrichum truncatum]KAF6787450.1 hypothetical protein CTRU02_10246 [Colletotrichum truncatum]
MRSHQSATALFALLATTASALSPARLHCLRSRNSELSRLGTCGMAGSVAHCLDMIPDDFTQADLEACWVHAGCDHAEAVVEAQWALDKCDEYGNLAAELRLRHVPIVARATTDTTDTATAATTAAATATGTAATATGTGSSSTKVCSTTTTVSTTACPSYTTGSKSGQAMKSGCFPTMASYATCAAGMLCSNDTCIVKQNSLTGGGIAVALFFAVSITGAIGIITFLCCRDRKNRKRIMAKAEAAAIAKASAVGKRPTVEVHPTEPHANQPLMSSNGGNQPYDAHDPFGDHNRR